MVKAILFIDASGVWRKDGRLPRFRLVSDNRSPTDCNKDCLFGKDVPV